ncbi:hypothetical protein EST38_g13196 [Candolleomyces aberdarensis]|uniref:Uncharacterized protein n=1 Tax=Candolleomyces aberdarensis TaxID=2316362 RepID=A0A4Q2D0F9_9AGAR|nr:hypothetical protein EST38_g13196 [Candolleomyces aberdarensis]
MWVSYVNDLAAADAQAVPLLGSGSAPSRGCMLVDKTTQYHSAVCLALAPTPALPPGAAPEVEGPARLGITIDDEFLAMLREGYLSDTFVKLLVGAAPGMPSIVQRNDLWFIDNHLVVPDVPKSYEAIRALFYWPGMGT